MLVEGYANWYFKSRVKPKKLVSTLVGRTLLDYDNGTLGPSFVHFYDAGQAQIILSTKLRSLKSREPALWNRLMSDLKAAADNGGMTIVVTKYFNLTKLRRVTVRLGAYEDKDTKEKRVFWMAVRSGLL